MAIDIKNLKKNGLNAVDAILAIEAGDLEAPEDCACAFQVAINSSTAWSLQGSFGRAMMSAIEAGDCMLGVNPARDYWGNRIPSRTEVQDGTKGSRGFVVAHRGEEWAAMLEAL